MTLAERLLEVFDRQKDDGTLVYSDEEVRRFIPLLLLLARQVDEAALSDELRPILVQFKQTIGLPDSHDAEALARAALVYLDGHPVNPQLLRDVSTVVQEVQGS